MIPTWLCFVLLGLVSGQTATTDDSVVSNCHMDGTKFVRSFLTDSQLTGCYLNTTGIRTSVGKGSTILYSIISNSTITDSILNATYEEPRLDNTSIAEVIQCIDSYYFNTVFDSELVNAVLDASNKCKCNGYYNSDIHGLIHGDGRYNNNSIHQSRIIDSAVRHSKVMVSNLTDDSAACISLIGKSDLSHSTMQSSIANNLKASTCNVVNSMVDSSICKRSKVDACKLSHCTVMDSTLKNSMNRDSLVINSTVKNSVVSNQSKILGSEVINSVVSNSKLTNCTIKNSNVNGKTYDSIKMINGMIVNSGMNSKQLFWFI